MLILVIWLRFKVSVNLVNSTRNVAKMYLYLIQIVIKFKLYSDLAPVQINLIIQR